MVTWFRAAVVRALKTVAQTAIATLGVTALVTDVNWAVLASTAGTAGLLSLLNSVAGLPEVGKTAAQEPYDWEKEGL